MTSRVLVYTFNSAVTLKELKGDIQYKRRHIIIGDGKTVYAFYIQMTPELFDNEQEIANYVINSVHTK